MRKDGTSLPVDVKALEKCLKMKNLKHQKASRDMGFSNPHISNVIQRGSITRSGAILLEKIHGISYEDYKPEEKKENPVQETMPISETVIVNKTELQLKTIIAQLGALNNNILATNSLLERIDKDIKVWEE